MPSRYLSPNWPAPPNIGAFTSLRALDDKSAVSRGTFAAFNLADYCGDSMIHVAHNRELLQADWQWQHAPVWLQQMHTAHVIAAHEINTGEIIEADASWTDRQGLPCVVMTADCLPVLLCHKKGTTVAAIHAGWRGLAAGIIENTVQTMNVNACNLLAWLGPAISQPCFEVGPEVRALFIKEHPHAETAFLKGNNDRWLADIYQLARLRLQVSGVHAIYGGEYCTFRQKDRFYSYRRDGQTGRMATTIWINTPEMTITPLMRCGSRVVSAN